MRYISCLGGDSWNGGTFVSMCLMPCSSVQPCSGNPHWPGCTLELVIQHRVKQSSTQVSALLSHTSLAIFRSGSGVLNWPKYSRVLCTCWVKQPCVYLCVPVCTWVSAPVHLCALVCTCMKLCLCPSALAPPSDNWGLRNPPKLIRQLLVKILFYWKQLMLPRNYSSDFSPLSHF